MSPLGPSRGINAQELHVHDQVSHPGKPWVSSGLQGLVDLIREDDGEEEWSQRAFSDSQRKMEGRDTKRTASESCSSLP